MVSVSTLQQEDKEFEVVEFMLLSAGGEGEIITVEEGLVSEKFNIAEKCLPEDIDRRSHSHLVDVEIPTVELRKVSVLIGKDVGEAHEVFEVRKSNKPDSQLQALRGPLGWVITGTIHNSQNHRNVSVNFVTCDKNLHYQVERFWKVEGFGTKTALKTRTDSGADCRHRNLILSREDMRAVNSLEKTTKPTADDHYETGLLWRRDDGQLPNNRKEAEMRLQSLRRKFHKDSSLEEKYRTTMEDYIAKGYARKLSDEEASKSSPRTWYLPHFAVTSSNKPNKVRIVFDAAAEHGTGLLWRRDDGQLPNNRKEAEMRLQSLRRKFHKDSSLEEKYRTTMEDYIAKGYARKLSDEEASKSSPRTWYLPHFAVTSSN